MSRRCADLSAASAAEETGDRERTRGGIETALSRTTVVSLSVVYFVMLHALSLLFYHAPAGPPPLHGPPPGHVELVFLYLSSFLSILIAGPGRFSLDGWLSRMRQPEKNAAGA